MANKMETGEAMRTAHHLSAILMFFLFSLAEGLALSNFWGRREMRMDIYTVCMMPVLIAIPLATTILAGRRIRNVLVEAGVNQGLLQNVHYWLTSLTTVFYAVLSLAMSLLLNAVMHLRQH